MSQNLKQALNGLSYKDLDWVGFRELREITTERHVRDGKPQSNDSSDSRGVMVEVLARGQFGYASTPATDPESLIAAAGRAREQALKAADHGVFKFTTAQRPKVTSRYNSPFLKPLNSHSAADINSTLIQISEKLKVSPKIARAEAYAQTVDCEMRFVSSNGSDAEQKFSLISTFYQATAIDGAVVQRRSGGGSLQGGWEHLYTDDLWSRVQTVGEQALELLSAADCPTETTSVILSPDQMMLQIHESIGHPLELDRILGDERNYAGWSFVKLEDFGKLKYGSSIMNVTFDPTIRGEFASYAFDDCGFAAEREFLIKDGILLRGLGGLESQARARVPGVANARASSWNRAPIDRMANINLEPGTSSLEEMIAGVECGVLMETNRSWSIDDFRNKFQFGCEYAKQIRNGKIVGTLRNPNYRGVTVPFWNSLKKVGNRSTLSVHGTPNCGKGEPNQIIRVGHASPVCLFENLEIFGGAS